MKNTFQGFHKSSSLIIATIQLSLSLCQDYLKHLTDIVSFHFYSNPERAKYHTHSFKMMKKMTVRISALTFLLLDLNS